MMFFATKFNKKRKLLRAKLFMKVFLTVIWDIEVSWKIRFKPQKDYWWRSAVIPKPEQQTNLEIRDFVQSKGNIP